MNPLTLRPPHSRRNVAVRPGGTLAAAQRHSPGAVIRRMLPSRPMLAIDAHDVTKTFKSGWLRPTRTAALRGVSLAVPRGAIVGLLGPNGAGKTTLLSILATLLTPDSGTVRVLGHDVVRDAARLRRRLNMASGRPSFLWSLRVGEIVAFYGRLYGLSGQKLRRRVDELIRSEEHTSELQSHSEIVCRLLLEKNKIEAAIVQWHTAPSGSHPPNTAR